MEEEILEVAKENDLSLDEAEELQDLVEETGLDAEEAHELMQEM